MTRANPQQQQEQRIIDEDQDAVLIRNSAELQLDNQQEEQEEMDAKEVIKRLQSLVKVNSPSKVPEAVRDLLNNSQQQH